MLGMKNHFDISGSIEIREVDIAGVACMYYIKPLLYDIIDVTLRFSQCYSTKCISYNMNCMGAVTQSNQMGTNKHHFVTKTLLRETVTKSQSNINNIVTAECNTVTLV